MSAHRTPLTIKDLPAEIIRTIVFTVDDWKRTTFQRISLVCHALRDPAQERLFADARKVSLTAQADPTDTGNSVDPAWSWTPRSRERLALAASPRLGALIKHITFELDRSAAWTTQPNNSHFERVASKADQLLLSCPQLFPKLRRIEFVRFPLSLAFVQALCEQCELLSTLTLSRCTVTGLDAGYEVPFIRELKLSHYVLPHEAILTDTLNALVHPEAAHSLHLIECDTTVYDDSEPGDMVAFHGLRNLVVRNAPDINVLLEHCPSLQALSILDRTLDTALLELTVDPALVCPDLSFFRGSVERTVDVLSKIPSIRHADAFDSEVRNADGDPDAWEVAAFADMPRAQPQLQSLQLRAAFFSSGLLSSIWANFPRLRALQLFSDSTTMDDSSIAYSLEQEVLTELLFEDEYAMPQSLEYFGVRVALHERCDAARVKASLAGWKDEYPALRYVAIADTFGPDIVRFNPQDPDRLLEHMSAFEWIKAPEWWCKESQANLL